MFGYIMGMFEIGYKILETLVKISRSLKRDEKEQEKH